MPPSNRFNPGSSHLIALLQGPSAQPTAMAVAFSTLTGDPVGEQTLPAQGVGVRSQQALKDLSKVCGGITNTKGLLEAFDFQVDEWAAKLPAKLPVSCETLSLQSLGIR